MGHSFFLSVFTMLISFCDCEKDQTHLSEKHQEPDYNFFKYKNGIEKEYSFSYQCSHPFLHKQRAAMVDKIFFRP